MMTNVQNWNAAARERCDEVRAQNADSWLDLLPVNSHGRHMLTLEKAKQLALLSSTSWCVGAYSCGFGIGKQTAPLKCDLYYIVDENNEPLRFDDLDAAINFLHTQLHIHRPDILVNVTFEKYSSDNSRWVPTAKDS